MSEREVEVKRRIAPESAARFRGCGRNENSDQKSRQQRDKIFPRERRSGGGLEIGTGKKFFLPLKIGELAFPAISTAKFLKNFSEAANEARYRTDGMGLGLYLARAIVENLGGKLWFESEAGKGSTFFISLPVIQK